MSIVRVAGLALVLSAALAGAATAQAPAEPAELDAGSMDLPGPRRATSLGFTGFILAGLGELMTVGVLETGQAIWEDDGDGESFRIGRGYVIAFTTLGVVAVAALVAGIVGAVRLARGRRQREPRFTWALPAWPGPS